MLRSALAKILLVAIAVLGQLAIWGVQLLRLAVGDRLLLESLTILASLPIVERRLSECGAMSMLIGLRAILNGMLAKAGEDGAPPSDSIAPVVPVTAACVPGPEAMRLDFNRRYSGQIVEQVLVFETPDGQSHISIVTGNGALDMMASTLGFCQLNGDAAQRLCATVEAACSSKS